MNKLVETFRKALMSKHSDDWSMEVISEAAHICAEVAPNHNLPIQDIFMSLLREARRERKIENMKRWRARLPLTDSTYFTKLLNQKIKEL